MTRINREMVPNFFAPHVHVVLTLTVIAAINCSGLIALAHRGDAPTADDVQKLTLPERSLADVAAEDVRHRAWCRSGRQSPQGNSYLPAILGGGWGGVPKLIEHWHV